MTKPLDFCKVLALGRVDQGQVKFYALLIRAEGGLTMSSKEVVQEETLRKLIVDSGGVLDNLLLIRIVEAAPSPTAADEYIKSLGWPNELARKVRNAVRLREEFSERRDWEKLKRTSIRPVESLFNFLTPLQLGLPDFPGVKISTTFRFDKCRVDRRLWPFFLQEFQISHFTTFDGTGKQRFDLVEGLDDPLLFDFSFEESFIESKFKFKGLNFQIGRTKMNHVVYSFTDELMTIRGKWVMIKSDPPKVKFPWFYKVLEVVYFNERLRFLIREDLGEGERKIVDWKKAKETLSGMVTFEKILPISENIYGNIVVVLSVNHFIRGNLSLYRYLSDNTIAVRLDQHSPNPNPFPNPRLISEESLPAKEVSREIAELAELAPKIYQTTPPSLERLAGLSLVENPPHRLSDLFINN